MKSDEVLLAEAVLRGDTGAAAALADCVVEKFANPGRVDRRKKRQSAERRRQRRRIQELEAANAALRREVQMLQQQLDDLRQLIDVRPARTPRGPVPITPLPLAPWKMPTVPWTPDDNPLDRFYKKAIDRLPPEVWFGTKTSDSTQL